MPPSNRKTRSKKERDMDEVSDGDMPEATRTPSRKKRKLNGIGSDGAVADLDKCQLKYTTEQGAKTVKSGKGYKNNEDEDNEMLSQDQVVSIIHSLRQPNYRTQASINHANEVHFRDNPNARPAYAKISGRDWTFFVNKKKVIIGRPVEASNRRTSVVETGEEGARDTPQGDSSFEVDIDLGPDKMISRVHAEIYFDSDTYNWIILVNGRNGLYLDDLKLSRGAKANLRSGSVINVHDTQMMFLTAGSEVVVHEMFRRQALQEQNDGSDDDEEEDQSSLSRTYAKLNAQKSGQSAENQGHKSSQAREQGSGKQNTKSHSALVTSTVFGLPSTPTSAREKDKEIKIKSSPNQIRGMMVESTEDIDYSLDTAKDLKPPRSYATLIGQAILASEEQKLTLAKIYEFIKENYAYYRLNPNLGWQNSIRHNLSLNKSFEKVARRTDEPGKGMKWQIVPEYRDELITRGLNSNRRDTLQYGSSDPNSPASKEMLFSHLNDKYHIGPKSTQTRQDTTDVAEERIKKSPCSVTPPLSSYPLATESFTPDRGPKLMQFKVDTELARGLEKGIQTPLYNRTKGTFQGLSVPSHSSAALSAKGVSIKELKDAAATSPPTLSSSMYADDGTRSINALETPLVTRQNLRLAPPSTAHLPSHYMLFSSPAPFWKYADLGSTPAKGPSLDLSPIKGVVVEEERGNPQSSSPPRAEGVGAGEDGEVSPSRTTSRPASRREFSSLSISQPMRPMHTSIGPIDDDVDGGIDLAKGFQKIGSFHSHRSLPGLRS